MSDDAMPPQQGWFRGGLPLLGWASDNPHAARALWQLCGGKPYYAMVVDEEAREAFAMLRRPQPTPPLGSLVCLLADGRTYVIAPDGACGAEQERVRLVGRYTGSLPGFGGRQ